ncbi:MAG TPA: MerR family transcriptional regulator [Agrococcus sp.]|nr:MerR family transcriptional regulator [Agrococcus sp.]
MRISELAARTGVPVATIKYYLREGLLPAGERTSATQAQYGEAHEQRLRLVRALVDVAHLSIQRTRQVLAVVDAPPASMSELLHLATDPDDSQATPRASAFLEGLDWTVPEGLGALDELERGLAGLADSGLDIPRAQLEAVAGAVDRVAEIEIDGVPTTSAEAAVAYSVLGTELVAPIILALRRIAHARHTFARFGHEPG